MIADIIYTFIVHFVIFLCHGLFFYVSPQKNNGETIRRLSIYHFYALCLGEFRETFILCRTLHEQQYPAHNPHSFSQTSLSPRGSLHLVVQKCPRRYSHVALNSNRGL